MAKMILQSALLAIVFMICVGNTNTEDNGTLCHCDMCGFDDHYSFAAHRCLEDRTGLRVRAPGPLLNKRTIDDCCKMCGEHGQFFIQPTTMRCKQTGVLRSGMTSILDAIKCDACLHLIELVRNVINSGSNAAKDQIAVCCDETILFAADCKNLLRQYWDKIDQAISEKVSPKGICHQLLGLCSTSGNLRAPPSTLADPFPVAMDLRDPGRHLGSGRFPALGDQGSEAGSCYAHATRLAVEGKYNAMSSKRDLSPLLSSQELVDCSQNYVASGGGSVHFALRYVNKKGLRAKSDYPGAETGVRSACQTRKPEDEIFGRGTLHRLLSSSTEIVEKAIIEHLQKPHAAPIIIVIQTTASFMHVRSEIWEPTNAECTAPTQEHALCIVGYGVDTEGTKYWTVANSYGPLWGEGGFGKLVRGIDVCSIAKEAYIII